MLTFLILSGVAATSFVAFRSRLKNDLPMGGGPPENRGEAVRRVLKHLQRKPIGAIQEGDAAVIVGTVYEVAGVQRIIAPLTTYACLGYHVDIRSAIYDEAWRLRQLCDEARCVAIEVRDDTGSILVDPQGLELAITSQRPPVYYPPFSHQILQRLPMWSHHYPITIVEGLLQPGARILVCGVAARDLAATDYRDGSTRLVLRASATFPLVASTDHDLFEPGGRPFAPQELRRR